ncbi:MAG: hypothetical protein GY769_07320 [bacterium]|nr:hypothetical protein [bacterium]
MALSIVSLSALLLVSLAGSALAAAPPVAVSPGHVSKLATVADACPTFSWTEVQAAARYELVLYEVGEVEGESTEVLWQTVPGGATSWTPSLGLCLERGGRYAWSARAVGAKAASEWSAPSLFQVAPGPSEEELEEALDVVRSYLGTRPEAAAPSVDGPAAMAARLEAAAPRSAATAVGAQLQVSRDSGPLTPMFHVTGNAGITGLYVDSFNRVGIRTIDMDREFNLDGTMVIDSSVGSNGILWKTASTALINGIIVSSSDLQMGIGRNQQIRIEDLSPASSIHIKANGNVGIGQSDPSTALDVDGDVSVSGYAELALTSGAPLAADCDEGSERGRMKVDNAAGLLYICADSGWVSK